MNVKRTSILAAAALALAAATLPGTAAADDRSDRGWRGHGHIKHWKHAHGHGHYKPWKRGFYGYAAPVVVPAPVFAVPYPHFVPAPVYAPPPPVYYPPSGNDLTIIWRAAW